MPAVLIERYTRTTIDLGSVTIEPGLWWEPHDDCGVIRSALKSMASIVRHMPGDSAEIAMAFGDLIRDKWPLRPYFVEVFGRDGEWFQEYSPMERPMRGRK